MVLQSRFQESVSKALDRLGLSNTAEWHTPDGLFSVDLILEARSTRGEPVVIEVDGPSHFTINTGRELGTTRLRRNLLRARGILVVSVPWCAC